MLPVNSDLEYSPDSCTAYSIHFNLPEAINTMITALELNKLLTTALESCKKAADGDSAEETRATDALRVLSQQRVTAELLAETEAGKRLKKLSKHTCKRIAEASAAAVEAWKDCIRKEQQSGNSGAATKQPSSQSKGQASDRESSQPPSQSQDTGSQPLSRSQSNKLVLEPAKTGDETRDKIRKLFAEALALALGPDVFGDPCATAVEVEQALFSQNGGVNQKYKAKFRSLSFNLKDPKNPDLRSRVLTGEIPGNVLVNLSAEEMASSEMRAKNEQIREHMKNESVRGQQTQASTDMFQCGKCKQRKCTYYQLQTRSADEFTFVILPAQRSTVALRWKFC